MKVVDIVLEDKLPTRPPPNREPIVEHDPSIFKKIPTKNLEQYTGSYWSDESSNQRNIYVKNDTLIYSINEGNTRKLLPTGKDNFKMIGSTSDIDVLFSKNEKKENLMRLKINPDRIIDYAVLTKPNLQDYIGSYFSDELQTIYQLEIENDALVVRHHRMDDIELEGVSKKAFLSDTYFLRMLEFVMDDSGEVIGFRASNGRVKNLWFERQ